MHETGAAQRPHLVVGKACARTRLGHEIGHGARVAERVGRLQVHEVRDREEGGVEALAGQHHGKSRLRFDHCIPRPDRIETCEQHVRFVAHELCELRVELLSAALACEVPGRVWSADPVGDLHELR